MPAEIDTGGHRVLHCDSHADCPTATIHVLTSASDERQTDRAHLSVRIDGKSQKKIPKDRRRKSAGNCIGKVVPLDCRRETSSSGRGKTARIPRIGDEEKTIPDERDFSEKSLALTQLSRRRREERTRGEEEDRVLELREACRAIEDVIKDERFSVTWNSREDADAHGDEIERAESRLRNGTERSRLAIVDASGSSITGHQSLRDRSWTRPRPSSYGSEDHDADPIDRPGRRRITEESSLLSSHRLHTRAKEEAFEDDFKDVDEGFFGKEHDDTWADGNAQLDYSGPRDERPENERGKRIVRNFEDRKRIRCACRDGSFLQLVFLLLLVVFGRHGLFDSSSVFRVNTRPITNCLSVLGFGIIGVVDARAFDSIGDTGIRAERSANLSHITGSFRKIQLYIRHRHLQILPDGTVNGSNDDTSDYTIFQRISVSRGQLRIQGIATCMYLCMDACGLPYGSMEFTQDCIFNETMETQNYNTYISARWSTKERTLYLGMDNSGKPRTITITGEDRKLGKMFDYARVLTQVASPDRVVETLHRRMLAGAKHNVRHQHHSHDHHRQIGSDVAQHAICPSSSIQKSVGDGRDSFRCRKRKKRKKRKRRCRPDEQPGPQCRLAEGSVTDSTIDRYVTDMSSEIISTTPESKRSCEGAASEEACRRQALSVPAKKRKSRIHSKFGKNKASTSNMKKPNVTVANSQSKKPNLTDGKKKMRKRTSPSQTSRGSTVMASPSRKRHEAGTTSLSRASSSLTAPVREEHLASTATSSSSPSPPVCLPDDL
ncbi:uncharacterized protein LOC105424460 isoform X2 [Pogonomyrmex barbatus]|uniref:Fibroblast growth factor n=1 Tax=Pogonomyrmex barbatus TaxID=144034 RepID=A0A6I9VXG3_9HYME|nr:uncharacterized protein LOC105424460 isoform X2 [Pogonomyrmex barbatus]XP_025073409.1 uncharacterized protein LOC105424460 isoform X2 [Pogonomyrmex barbatus]